MTELAIENWRSVKMRRLEEDWKKSLFPRGKALISVHVPENHFAQSRNKTK